MPDGYAPIYPILTFKGFQIVQFEPPWRCYFRAAETTEKLHFLSPVK